MTREEVIGVLQSPEGREETRRIYRLRKAYELVAQTIYGSHPERTEAEQLVDALAELAEQYFPGSADTFGIIYGHRLKRAIAEVYGPGD
jgi:hypothetical protein